MVISIDVRTGTEGYSVFIDGKLCYLGLSDAGLRDVYTELFEAELRATCALKGHKWGNSGKCQRCGINM